MRRDAKADANQAEIVEALRRAGYSVAHTHALGRGFPDIVVGGVGLAGRRFNVLLELKSDLRGRLTADEKRWHAAWQGQVDVVRDAQEAVRLIQRHREVN